MLHDAGTEAPVRVNLPVPALAVVPNTEPEREPEPVVVPMVEVADGEKMRLRCGMCDTVNMSGLTANSGGSLDGDDCVARLPSQTWMRASSG